MIASRRRLVAALGLAPLAAATVSGCGTTDAMTSPADVPAPPTSAPPRVRVGDRWRYVEINAYNSERIAELDCVVVQTGPQLRVRRADSRGQPRADEVYDGAWRVVVEPFYDRVQTFVAPLPLLPEPPAPREAATVRTQYRTDDGPALLDWQERHEATRWERIRVPAGEFDALRIERRIWFTHADARRRQSVRVERLWYAPAVQRWVRREWSGEYLGWPIHRGGPAREDRIVHALLAYAPATA